MTLVVGHGDLFHELRQNLPLRRRENSHGRFVSPSCGTGHGVMNFNSFRRQSAPLRTAVGRGDRSADETPSLKAPERPRGRRSVQSNSISQGGLIGLDAGHQLRQQAVLKRRDAEYGTFLAEEADVYLMQPPDQKSGALCQRPSRVEYLTLLRFRIPTMRTSVALGLSHSVNHRRPPRSPAATGTNYATQEKYEACFPYRKYSA